MDMILALICLSFKLLSMFIFFLTVTPELTDAKLLCDEPFVHFQYNCYYFANDKRSFEEAETVCNEYSSPSNPCHLTSIHYEEELAFINQRANQTWQVVYYWLGAKKSLANGSFFWLDGSPMNFTKYLKGVEYYGKCLYQRWKYVWDVTFCVHGGFKKYFVCKKAATKTLRTLNCDQHCFGFPELLFLYRNESEGIITTRRLEIMSGHLLSAPGNCLPDCCTYQIIDGFTDRKSGRSHKDVEYARKKLFISHAWPAKTKSERRLTTRFNPPDTSWISQRLVNIFTVSGASAPSPSPVVKKEQPPSTEKKRSKLRATCSVSSSFGFFLQNSQANNSVNFQSP